MEDKHLLEQIDACRPGGQDLASADMADLAARLAQEPRAQELYNRVQALDVRITAAVQQVAVPVGLANRVLARLAAASVSGTAPTTATESEPPAPAAPPVIAIPFYRRRKVRAMAGVLALAATVAWMVFWPTSLPTADEIPARALAFFEQDPGSTGPTIDSPTLPPSPRVQPFRQKGRFVSDFLGRTAMAYDLGTVGRRAVLYVTRMNVAGLPSAPPANLVGASGGPAAVAWQESGLLYVLVVERGDRDYHRFVRPQGLVT